MADKSDNGVTEESTSDVKAEVLVHATSQVGADSSGFTADSADEEVEEANQTRWGRLPQSLVTIALLLVTVFVAQITWQWFTERGSRLKGDSVRTPVVFQLDINSAETHHLQALPDIGSMLAKRIVRYREEYGPFETTEQLLEVKGFGPARLQRLRPMLIVGPRPSAASSLSPVGEEQRIASPNAVGKSR